MRSPSTPSPREAFARVRANAHRYLFAPGIKDRLRHTATSALALALATYVATMGAVPAFMVWFLKSEGAGEITANPDRFATDFLAFLQSNHELASAAAVGMFALILLAHISISRAPRSSGESATVPISTDEMDAPEH